MIQVDLTHMRRFIALPYEAALAPRLRIAHNHLQKSDGAGGDFTGWVRLPQEYDRQEFGRIQAAARRIQSDSRALVVIGIGGSYLGARGVIECLCSPNYNLRRKDTPNIYFVGNGLSSDALGEVLDLVADVDFSVNVISKSGTTTEPAIAFRLIRSEIERRYGRKEAARRIVAVTDRSRGALKTLADREGYRTFVIPDDVGGRYSVLTPVGLLPLAAAGIDIRSLLAGACEMERATADGVPFDENPAARYAAVRNILYRQGFMIEILASYEPQLQYLAEWWKQLFGESEGKQGRGIFPASVTFTADLHSMGQYIQEGERTLFETVVSVAAPEHRVKIGSDPDNLDGLNFLTGKRLSEINHTAELGVSLAHADGGVPNLRIEIPRIDARSLGTLIYFFEKACGISGYLLGVNPFDQPGVEAYKKNMFALLGKPGYEEEAEKLRRKL